MTFVFHDNLSTANNGKIISRQTRAVWIDKMGGGGRDSGSVTIQYSLYMKSEPCYKIAV
jgi:hypothetical protein